MLFPTLMSKTFLILSASLVFSYAGAQLILNYFRRAHARGAPFVTAKLNQSGETDLVVEGRYLMTWFWPAAIASVLCFIMLMFLQERFPLNMLMMALFALTNGITLGAALISIDENLAIKVSWLTALLTLFAGTIGLYSGIDFAFLERILFWSLIGFLAVAFLRIFVSIKGPARKLIAMVGVLIFVGYLLYDFNKIKKLKSLPAFNAWNTALDSAIDIYLDIINLFLQLLDLLSNES